MKCRKCGAEISESAKFCENCGAPIEAEVNETPVTSEAPVVNEEVVATAVEETVSAAAAVGEASFAETKETFSPIPEEPVKKKKPVWAGITAAVVGVIAILAVLVCCTKVGGNLFRKIFFSPEKYLAYVLQDNFGKSIDDGLTVYDEYIKNYGNADKMDVGVKFEVALGDEFSNYVAEYATDLSSEAEWVTWIKKATIEYGVRGFEGDKEFRLKVGANDVDLVSGSAVLMKDGNVYFSVPELVTKTLHMELTPEQTEAFSKITDMSEAIYKELPTKPELQNISKKYLKAIFNNVKDVKRTNDTIAVEDISAKATVLTMDLDDVVLTQMEIDLLEEFLKDEEFEKIWNRVYDAYEEVLSDASSVTTISGDADSYEEIKNNAQTALDAAKEKLAKLEDKSLENEVKATIKIYVDNKGVISGWDIHDDETTFSYIQPSKGGRFGVKAVVGESGDDGITVTGTGKESADVVTAELTAFADNEKLFDVYINNFDKSINKKGEGSFDIAITNVNFGEDSESDLEVLKEIIGDTNVGFYYKGTVSKNNAEVSMAIGNGEKNLFSVGAVTEIKDASAIEVAGKDSALELNFDDETVMVELIKAVDGETLVKNLRDAGAIEELASTLESSLAYLKSLAEYYDY